MPKISTYNTVTPQGSDKIVISQKNGTPQNVTKNISVDDLRGYIGESTGIPTPNIFVIKNMSEVNANRYKVCIEKPIETDWLDKNPRLFMFRYKKSKHTGSSGSYSWKRRGFIHPSHQNGVYQETNFPGSNWGSAPLLTESQEQLPPISTEWDINTELQIAKTDTLITDFASLRPTTYIEIPFNKLQFLYNTSNPSVPITDFPTPSLSTGIFCNVRGGNKHNTYTPWDDRLKLYSKVILKFAIGIPNPKWTNTNHETPYIMGSLSNAINIVYAYNGDNYFRVVITLGSNATVARSV